MIETDKIKMQTELIGVLDKWLDEQMEKERVDCCPELARMMAVAALAVAEASAQAYANAEERGQV